MTNIVSRDTKHNAEAVNLDDPLLADPYAGAGAEAVAQVPQIETDLALQTELVAQIVADREIALAAAAKLPAEAFVMSAHKIITQLVYDYVTKYRAPIPPTILQGQFRAKIKDHKDAAAKLAALNELRYAYHASSRDFYFDEVQRLGRDCATRKAVGVWLKDHDVTKLARTLGEIQVAAAEEEDDIYTDDDVDSFTGPVWMVENLIEAGSLVCLFGSSGSGKTFVGLELAHCVALGLPFVGNFATKAGAVAYVCSEGGKGGYKIRRDAWKSHHGVDKVPNYIFTLASYDLSGGAADVLSERFKAKLGKNPDLIIIDTLSCNYGAGDVDKNKDMLAFLAGVRRLRALTGATVCVVHHTGWSEKDRETGAKSLRNTIETSILVSREGDRVTVQPVKQRNAAVGEAFILKSVPVGKSAVLSWEGTKADVKKSATDTTANDDETTFVSAVPVTDEPGDGTTLAEVRDQTGLSNAKCERLAKELTGRNVVCRWKPPKANQPYRYFRPTLIA